MKRIYLDHGATTSVAKEVIEEMKLYFDKKFGNASSLHNFGIEAREGLEKARGIISKKLNGKNYKIIFTSGGTESNNFALKGIAFANKNKGNHIITTRVEHACIMESCKWLEGQGFRITYLNVDNEGFVKLDELEKAITKETILVSVIHGNNEIGTINPLRKIGDICREKGIYFHTDACQSFTKVPIDLEKDNVDLITINSHKIFGPKGVGALVIKNNVKITPLLHGGGHEAGYRSGTENVSGIVGFAKAVEIMNEEKIEYMRKLRDKLIKGILEIENSKLNGSRENRLCNNANLSFEYIEGESLVLHLDDKGIAASTGSACSSRKLEPSHVLLAIGLSPVEAHGSLRLTTGIYNTKEEIEYTIESVKQCVERLRKISPLKGSKICTAKK
jgi:cysteine desulfurase